MIELSVPWLFRAMGIPFAKREKIYTRYDVEKSTYRELSPFERSS